MQSSATIRPAVDADIPAITGIYAHYVEHTTSSFETDPPDATESARRRLEIERHGLPYLVAEIDQKVVGYAYAVPYRPRKAYRFTVEDSIYIDPAHTGKGLGRMLLPALIDKCQEQGYRQMVAVIGGSDNLASIRLHERFGFWQVGVLRGAGFKFGRWADSVLMQRSLGDGEKSLPKEL